MAKRSGVNWDELQTDDDDVSAHDTKIWQTEDIVLVDDDQGDEEDEDGD